MFCGDDEASPRYSGFFLVCTPAVGEAFVMLKSYTFRLEKPINMYISVYGGGVAPYNNAPLSILISLSEKTQRRREEMS